MRKGVSMTLLFRERVRRPLAAGGIAVLTLLTLVACSANPGGEKQDKAATQPAVSTGVTETGPVTLVVWDMYSDTPGKELVDELNRDFEAKYPNVTIKRVVKSFNDYFATLKLGLSGSKAPDVAVGNQGWAADGPLVKAGLLLPLDKYAKAYGWEDRFGSTRELRFTADGKQWGTGQLYGIPHYAALVGFFYNRDKLAKLGIELPRTFPELEQALAKAKQAGEIPIQFGDLDKWPGSQEYAMIQNVLASATDVNDWIYGTEGARFDTEANLAAARKLKEWADKGYFTPGFNGVSYDDAVSNFQKGQGVFFFSGTWLNDGYQEALGESVGWMPSPPMEEGGTAAAIGTFGEPWHIVASTEHPDVAAAYLDFITGQQAGQKFQESGIIPATALPSAGASEGLLADSVEALASLGQANALTAYLDWSTPNMGNVLDPGLQELMGGKTTPEELLSKVQAEHDDFYGGQ